MSDQPKPVLVKAKVKENIPLGGTYHLLKFSHESQIPNSLPGQFFMLGLPGRLDPLLKRPFGYFRRDENTIEFLYRVRGKMTNIMGGLKEGDEMEILGPLGNRYPELRSRKTALIVAGGIGIVPVYPLIDLLKERAVVIYGGKSKADLLLANDLKEKSVKELILATDDGSMGTKGTVLDAIKGVLSKGTGSYTLYSCGPMGMLRALSSLDVEGYIALEENMACGIGVCLGCAVKTKKGFQRVCKEGPVFNMKEVVFE